MRRLHPILAIFGVAASSLLSLRFLIRRGPIEWRRPETILTRSDPAERQTAPYLLLLNAAREVLPEGAAVALVPADTEVDVGRSSMDYVIAVGQMPRQVVVPGHSTSLFRSRETPRFILVYGGATRTYEQPVLARNEIGVLLQIGR